MVAQGQRCGGLPAVPARHPRPAAPTPLRTTVGRQQAGHAGDRRRHPGAAVHPAGRADKGQCAAGEALRGSGVAQGSAAGTASAAGLACRVRGTQRSRTGGAAAGQSGGWSAGPPTLPALPKPAARPTPPLPPSGGHPHRHLHVPRHLSSTTRQPIGTAAASSGASLAAGCAIVRPRPCQQTPPRPAILTLLCCNTVLPPLPPQLPLSSTCCLAFPLPMRNRCQQRLQFIANQE